VFTVNVSGSGDGVIFHADNSLVSATNPAKSGEQVVIYCTGLGPTTPSFATGSAVTGNNQTVSPIAVAIGGKSAAVVYSGLTVGFAGLYQINVVVPAGLTGSQSIALTAGADITSRLELPCRSRRSGSFNYGRWLEELVGAIAFAGHGLQSLPVQDFHFARVYSMNAALRNSPAARVITTTSFRTCWERHDRR